MPTVFETERLIVRDWDPDKDSDAAFAMYTNPIVMQFLGGGDKAPESVEIQRERLILVAKRYGELADGTGFWAVQQKSSGTVIGASILKQLPGYEEIEVGWHLLPEHWGKGFATESAKGALDYGFESLGLLTIIAVVKAENEASIRVTRRLEMKPGGTVRAYDMELLRFVKARRPV